MDKGLKAYYTDNCDTERLLAWIRTSMVGEEDLQCTNNEHHCDSDLLLPVQLETKQLRYWQSKHPAIEHDADRGIRPSETIHVQTGPLMFSVPTRPIVTNRAALKYSKQYKKHPKANIEDHSYPEETANHSSWKDP